MKYIDQYYIQFEIHEVNIRTKGFDFNQVAMTKRS